MIRKYLSFLNIVELQIELSVNVSVLNCIKNKKRMRQITLLIFALLFVVGCRSNTLKTDKPIDMTEHNSNTDTATFAAGCFWCVEAVFQELKGVVSVTSGYMGGKVQNPTYTEVCTGTTGHAEACQIVFNPEIISFEELLEAFWGSHDPTTLNRQGGDKGTQYRSAIFYHSETQKQLAITYKNKLNAEKAFDHPVVTEISPASFFYKAEDYHQNYFNENGDAPYCSFVIAPKVEKFRKVFKSRLK